MKVNDVVIYTDRDGLARNALVLASSNPPGTDLEVLSIITTDADPACQTPVGRSLKYVGAVLEQDVDRAGLEALHPAPGYWAQPAPPPEPPPVVEPPPASTSSSGGA